MAPKSKAVLKGKAAAKGKAGAKPMKAMKKAMQATMFEEVFVFCVLSCLEKPTCLTEKFE